MNVGLCGDTAQPSQGLLLHTGWVSSGWPLSTCTRVFGPPGEPRAAPRAGVPGGPGPHHRSLPHPRLRPEEPALSPGCGKLRGLWYHVRRAFCIELFTRRVPVSQERGECCQRSRIAGDLCRPFWLRGDFPSFLGTAWRVPARSAAASLRSSSSSSFFYPLSIYFQVRAS